MAFRSTLTRKFCGWAGELRTPDPTVPLYQTRPGEPNPLKPTDFRRGLATFGITAPKIYYSTATEVLLSATYYHTRQRGNRWVMRLVYGEAGGLEVRPLYQIWAEYGEVAEAQH